MKTIVLMISYSLTSINGSFDFDYLTSPENLYKFPSSGTEHFVGTDLETKQYLNINNCLDQLDNWVEAAKRDGQKYWRSENENVAWFWQTPVEKSPFFSHVINECVKIEVQ